MNQIFKMTKRKLLLLPILVICSGFTMSQKINTVKVSINVKDATLSQIFDKITKETEFNFTYGELIAKNKTKYDAVYDNIFLNNILLDLGERAQLDFKVVDTEIMVAQKIKKLETDKSVIQQMAVTGLVTDLNGLPLLGAYIKERGTTNGTTTDFDGRFNITVTNNNTVLVVSYLGFVTQEITIGDQTTLNITLVEDIAKLDQVVVTALGIKRAKSALSYATQSLDNEQFNQSRNGDLASQLQSQVAGLNISQLSTGGLVSSSRIVLRGETSLNFSKNQPLIIVDGVPVSSNFDGNGSTNQQDDIPTDFGNGLTGINPDDVESVNVLKGATAAALYGSRAANGAIVITTKSGKGEGFRVTVSSNVTFESVSRSWDFQNEYGAGLGGNYINGLGLNYGPKLDGTTIVPIMGFPDTADQPLLPYAKNTFVNDFFETGISTNNNVSIASSGKRGNLRVSYTNQNKTGIIPNTDFKKEAFSVKANQKVNDKLTLDVVGNYIKTGSDNLPVIGYGGQSIGYSALFWPRNGSLDWIRDYWRPGQEYVAQNHVTFFTADNPWLIVNENLNGFSKNRVFGNTKLTYQVNDNFNVFVRAGTDFYSDRRLSRRPIAAAQFRNGMYNPQNIDFQENNFDFLATYIKEFNPETILDVMLGGNILEQRGSSFDLDSRDLAVPGIYNAGNIEDNPRTEEFNFEKQVNSIYATAQLNLKDAIYLTASARNDWSSTLPQGNNSYFYPSFGASFVLSKLIELPEAISRAKIRTSWAQVGGDTDAFLIQQTYNYGTLPGSVTNQPLIANEDLRPERTNSFEIGTELSFLKNRLNLEFNYYNNVSKDQILQSPTTATSGFSSKLINAGEINNNGVEFVLNATPIRSDKFKWNVVLNYAKNRSEVVSLADGIESFILVNGGVSSGTFTIEARPGGQYGDLYGPVFERSPQGEIIFDNGLPIVAAEVGNLGNINPDWTGGLINTFTYKGISLNIIMDYRSGGVVYSGSNSVFYVTGSNPESLVGREDGIIGDGVIDNGDGTFRPNDVRVSGQTYHFDGFNGRNNAETNVFDATYFKLRQASLNFDLTNLFKSNKYIKGANLSVFGRNLIVWSKSDALRHWDPEIVTNNGNGVILPGVETAQLPGTRTVGINMTLEF